MRSTQAYLIALQRLGYETTLVCSNASTPRDVAATSVRAAIPGVKQKLYRAIGPKKWAIGPGFLRHIPTIISSDFVIVHGVRIFPLALAAFACSILNRRFAIVPHAGLDKSRHSIIRQKWPLLFPVYMHLTKWMLQRAEAIIVSGPLEERTLDVWVPRERLVEIENFFDLPALPPPPRTKKTMSFIFVGRLSPDKGILSFINCWRLIAPESAEITIVGTGSGQYFEELYNVSREDSRVTLAGELNRQEVDALLSKASILVLPTGMDEPVTENFGNVVVEALAQGSLAMVASGLHWSKYTSSPAIIEFEPTPSGAAEAIKFFSSLSDDAFIHASKSAVELSTSFRLESRLSAIRAVVEKQHWR